MLKFAVTGRPDRLTSFVEEQARRKRKHSIEESRSSSSSSFSSTSSSSCSLSSLASSITEKVNSLDNERFSFRYEDAFSLRSLERNLSDSRDALFNLEESMDFGKTRDRFDRSDYWRKNVRGGRKSFGRADDRWNTLRGNMNKINAILPHRSHSVSSSLLPDPDSRAILSYDRSSSKPREQKHCADCQNFKSCVVDDLTKSYEVLFINNGNDRVPNDKDVDNEPQCKRPRLGSLALSKQADENVKISHQKIVMIGGRSKKTSHLKLLYNKFFGKKKGSRTTPKFHKNVQASSSPFGSTIPDCTFWELNSSRDTVFNLSQDDVSL